MNTYWFALVALYVVMFLFNGNVPVTQPTKTAINLVAIIGTIILTILAFKA